MTTEDEREAAERQLDALVCDLELDSIRVLVRVAARLVAGRKAYGDLDIQGDPRDWRREAAEEALDMAVYLACQALRVVGPV
jgi:hypothetical protein